MEDSIQKENSQTDKTKITLELVTRFEGNPVIRVACEDSAFPIPIYCSFYASSDKIDGCWLIRMSREAQSLPAIENYLDKIHDEVVGVTSHEDAIPEKIYGSAKNYANEKADYIRKKNLGDIVIEDRINQR